MDNERLLLAEIGILKIRGHRVLLDSTLAKLYGVTTKRLNEQVRRNPARFPEDFMFQLTAEEALPLRSQFATLEPGRGRHRKYQPYAFTEQGVAMLSSVLGSEQAVQVNVEIMRAFVRMRATLAEHQELGRRLDELEQRYDENFKAVFDAIRGLMAEADTPKRKIGFRDEGE